MFAGPMAAFFRLREEFRISIPFYSKLVHKQVRQACYYVVIMVEVHSCLSGTEKESKLDNRILGSSHTL